MDMRSRRSKCRHERRPIIKLLEAAIKLATEQPRDWKPAMPPLSVSRRYLSLESRETAAAVAIALEAWIADNLT